CGRTGAGPIMSRAQSGHVSFTVLSAGGPDALALGGMWIGASRWAALAGYPLARLRVRLTDHTPLCYYRREQTKPKARSTHLRVDHGCSWWWSAAQRLRRSWRQAC